MITRRALGPTGLTVSSVIAGAAAWHQGPDGSGIAPEQTVDLVGAMLRDRVVTTIDTSNNYGFGGSERRIAYALEQNGATTDDVLVQTKADRARGTIDFSAAQMRRSLAESMERLGVDHLPMVYLHDPENTTWDAAMADDGPVAALVAARDEGLIGALGISGGPPDLLRRFIDTGHFDALITHNRFTLVQRTADDLIEHAAAAGLGVLNAAPYGRGILTRWPRETDTYAYGRASKAMIAAVDRIGELCHDAGVPLAAAALQWSLRDPRITATIVGFQGRSDYEQTLELAEVDIPDDLWAAIESVPLDSAHVSRPDGSGPYTRPHEGLDG